VLDPPETAPSTLSVARLASVDLQHGASILPSCSLWDPSTFVSTARAQVLGQSIAAPACVVDRTVAQEAIRLVPLEPLETAQSTSTTVAAEEDVKSVSYSPERILNGALNDTEFESSIPNVSHKTCSARFYAEAHLKHSKRRCRWFQEANWPATVASGEAQPSANGSTEQKSGGRCARRLGRVPLGLEGIFSRRASRE